MGICIFCLQGMYLITRRRRFRSQIVLESDKFWNPRRRTSFRIFLQVGASFSFIDSICGLVGRRQLFVETWAVDEVTVDSRIPFSVESWRRRVPCEIFWHRTDTSGSVIFVAVFVDVRNRQFVGRYFFWVDSTGDQIIQFNVFSWLFYSLKLNVDKTNLIHIL